MNKFKLVPEKRLENLDGYEFFGVSYRDGICLGIPFDKEPIVEGDVGLYLLNKRYGRYNQTNVDDYKQTFGYVFYSNKVQGCYLTLYDYKGYISCGLGMPKTLVVTKELAEELNEELEELLDEALSDVKIYDYIFGIDGWKKDEE